jgi:hypothetical protein
MAKHACASRLPEQVRGPDDVVEYVLSRRRGCAGKGGGAGYDFGEIVLGFDTERRITGCAVRSDGDHPPTDTQQLVDIAVELEAAMLVLVTFVDSPTLLANLPGVEMFSRLVGGCAADHIYLADHIVIAGHHWRSLAEAGGGRRLSGDRGA